MEVARRIAQRLFADQDEVGGEGDLARRGIELGDERSVSGGCYPDVQM